MPDVTVATAELSSGRITLVANTVSTITFAKNVSRVQVWTDGTADVYVTTNGDTPTVDGKNSFEVPMGTIGEFGTLDTPVGDVVKMISAGAPKVRVEVLAL